jgi:hypothetical protein
MAIDRIAEPWGDRTPYGRGERWPVRVDMQLADGLTADDVERWVPSASVLHSNGDGIDTDEGGGAAGAGGRELMPRVLSGTGAGSRSPRW